MIQDAGARCLCAADTSVVQGTRTGTGWCWSFSRVIVPNSMSSALGFLSHHGRIGVAGWRSPAFGLGTSTEPARERGALGFGTLIDPKLCDNAELFGMDQLPPSCMPILCRRAIAEAAACCSHDDCIPMFGMLQLPPVTGVADATLGMLQLIRCR